MTVPARRPIPIPGSTAAIIVVAGAVITEEDSINIMLACLLSTWSSHHR